MRTIKLHTAEDADLDIEIEVASAPGTTTPVAKEFEERLGITVLARAVKTVANRLRQELLAVSDPDELGMEFGVSLKGGGAVLISAEGTFKVQLKWVKKGST